MFHGEISAAPGSISQVREATGLFLHLAKGLGVSIVPELVLSRRPEGIVLRPFEPEYHRVLGIALPENGGNAPALKLFMDFVKSYCETDKAGGRQ